MLGRLCLPCPPRLRRWRTRPLLPVMVQSTPLGVIFVRACHWQGYSGGGKNGSNQREARQNKAWECAKLTVLFAGSPLPLSTGRHARYNVVKIKGPEVG